MGSSLTAPASRQVPPSLDGKALFVLFAEQVQWMDITSGQSKLTADDIPTE